MFRLTIFLWFFSLSLMSSQVEQTHLKTECQVLTDCVDDLCQTTSYRTLETLYFSGSILYALYSLGYGDITETANIVMALGLGFVISPLYDKIKSYLPLFTTKLDGYAPKEVLGVLYFVENRLKISLVSLGLTEIASNWSLPTVAAANTDSFSSNFAQPNMTMPACPRFTESICGFSRLNKHEPYVLSFMFLNPEQRVDEYYLLGCGNITEQKKQFEMTIIKPIISWMKVHRNVPVFFAIDPTKISPAALHNSVDLWCHNLQQKNIDPSLLSIIDINDIEEYERFKPLELGKQNIYWLVDLIRFFAPIDIFKHHENIGVVISIDLDIQPIPKKILLSLENIIAMHKAGLALLEFSLTHERTLLPGLQAITKYVDKNHLKDYILDPAHKALKKGQVAKDFEAFIYYFTELWNLGRQKNNDALLPFCHKDIEKGFKLMAEHPQGQKSLAAIVHLLRTQMPKDFAAIPGLKIPDLYDYMHDFPRKTYTCKK